MSKGAYMGVDGIARKVKKIYVGVDGLSRRIKKAYIGIGGVARPCWGTQKLEYYGTITNLNYGMDAGAATSVGNYALFGGGKYYNSAGIVATDAVYAYHRSSLGLIQQIRLRTSVYEVSATTVGGYALFGGGRNSSSESNVNNYVTAFNENLSSSYLNLVNATSGPAATTVGDYALFGGGSSTNSVTAFNKSLTRSVFYLSKNMPMGMAATTVGIYALFGGGYLRNNGYCSSTVEAFDSSLTKVAIQPTDLNTAVQYLSATTVGNYALFAGGLYSSGNSNKASATVTTYNRSLTKGVAENLSQGRSYMATTTVGDYALFGGGYDYSTRLANVDAYDSSLTHTTATDLSVEAGGMCATTIGNYALFAGGYTDGGSYPTAVNVYEVK